MTPEQIVIGLQWFFLCYFVALHGGYLMLNVLAALAMSRAMGRRVLDELPRGFGRFEPPISVLVPAYNESGSIVGSLHSLLQLSYSEYELVVINDGSRDDTLAALMQAFDLRPFPEAYRVRLPTQPVRSVYRSLKYPNLRVIDKENGGKADALNAGINAARYPLFCAVDADSILQRDSLSRVVQPFLEDPLTVASGGTVRIANGCEISGGFLQKAALPRHPLALIQIMEYLRAFLFGRLGWVPLNALLIISGAFGVFNKERVVSAGGYRHDTVGEDMELVVRLHRQLRQAGIPYRIHFLPDPICWTEAPEDLRTLKNQRIRWQTGLAQSLMMNRSLLFHRRGGWAGWLAFPFMLLFEFAGPLIEVAGYVFMTLAWMWGGVSGLAFAAFLFLSFGLGLLLSATALLLEEFSFHLYTRPRDLLRLFLAALLENFGYRQLNSVWRLLGLLRWLRGGRQRWGEMKRKTVWQEEPSAGSKGQDSGLAALQGMPAFVATESSLQPDLKFAVQPEAQASGSSK